MDKLDSLVAEHVAGRLLQPERLEEVLASVLDRRQERAGRRREHVAELNKRAAETELRLKRLYDAIEAGIADLDDPALKDRIARLKTIRDQAQADAQRVEVADKEVRIMGSKSALLRALSAVAGAKPATAGVRSSVLKWRMGWDSNPR
jgi:site-specific DNA recombinase